MPQVIALSCPVCAGPLSENASRCAFCGSLVAIKPDFARIDAARLNRSMVAEHIARYRADLRRDPNDETAHYGLGVAYFNLGLMDEAADELKQAARLRPENPHIQNQLAVVYAELARRGRADASALAADRIERALLLDPAFPDALILRARLAGRRQDWAGAITDLRLAAKSDFEAAGPKLGKALTKRAAQLLLTKQWTQGVALLEEAIALNPEAARPGLAAVVKANEPLLADRALDALARAAQGAGNRPPALLAGPPRSPARTGWVAFAKVLGVAFAALVVSAVVVGLSDASGVDTLFALVMLAGLIAMAASPIVGIVAWRRAVRTSSVATVARWGGAPREGFRERRDRRRAQRLALVTGTETDDARLLAAARHVAQARQQQDAAQAKRRR